MSTRKRPRNARAAANDAAIATAAVGEILRVGIDRVSLREVALRAGLTHGAAYARYEDVSELLADLWNSKLGAYAIEMLELCVRAVEDRSGNSLDTLIDRIFLARAEDVAMVEMLLVSRRMPILYEVVEPSLKKHVYLRDDMTEEERARYSRALSLLGFMMLSLFEAHYFDDDRSHLDLVKGVLTTVLQETPAAGAPVTIVRDEVARPDEDDFNLRARLVYATYVVVSKSGYHEATISRIARRANCSPGAIYKLYQSKQDLVQDTFRATFAPANVAADPSRPRGPAEFLSVTTRQWRNRAMFAVETAIAAAHNDALRRTVSTFLEDPGRLLSNLVHLDEIQRTRIGEFVHAGAALAQGMQWMSVVMSTEAPRFDEFSENIQLALVNQWSSSVI